MLGEIFMWLERLSLLKSNKKVATARLLETFGYLKREARILAEENH